jgi:hypothetical protein
MNMSGCLSAASMRLQGYVEKFTVKLDPDEISPSRTQATPVVPDPINGSRTTWPTDDEFRTYSAIAGPAFL